MNSSRRQSALEFARGGAERPCRPGSDRHDQADDPRQRRAGPEAGAARRCDLLAAASRQRQAVEHPRQSWDASRPRSIAWRAAKPPPWSRSRHATKAERVRSRGVLDGLGLKFNAVPAATGGPFVPVKLPPANQSFARALTQASIARARAEDLGNTLTFVPLRKPLTSELDMTSPFGVRIDPFVHEASMHTGMDFRGKIGDPIHATAAGKVVKAGWEGGYGQMVEIDHGEGLTSRYGHLSEIDVSVGQTVRVGQVIGRLGSTGRSTGPHLHYETRINGEAVNPEKFLSAGVTLFGERPITGLAPGNSAQD